MEDFLKQLVIVKADKTTDSPTSPKRGNGQEKTLLAKIELLEGFSATTPL